jgi:hypothetical protein
MAFATACSGFDEPVKGGSTKRLVCFKPDAALRRTSRAASALQRDFFPPRAHVFSRDGFFVVGLCSKFMMRDVFGTKLWSDGLPLSWADVIWM